MPPAPPLPGPFATATVGRIYLAQGKLDRAEAIFRALLERRPGDPAAEAGLAAVAARRAALAAAAEDTLDLDVAADHLRGRFRLSAAGIARARRLLPAGAEGDLVLRVVGFSAAGAAGAADLALSGREGGIDAPLPPGALALAAAVGLLGGARFVPIVHRCAAIPAGSEQTA